jgi:hypothetical protein
MVRKACVALVGTALVALLAGCRKTPAPQIIDVEGVVRLGGKPLYKAEVRFVPVTNHDPCYIATGVTDAAGRFKLTCNGQPGACVGENRVLVMEAEIPSHLQGEEAQLELARYLRSLGGRPLPPRYANLAESPLTADVKPQQKAYTFDLTP